MSTFNWSEENNRCFGCGDNPIGLQLEFSRDGKWIVTKTSLSRNYQGFKESAHGGIVATLLDEASAWVAIAETGHLAPSIKLNCRFIKQVPLEEEIEVRAKVVEQRHGVVKTNAQVKDLSGDILARAEATCRVLEEEIDLDEIDLL